MGPTVCRYFAPSYQGKVFQTSCNAQDVTTLVRRCGGWLKVDVVEKCNIDHAMKVSKNIGPRDVKGR